MNHFQDRISRSLFIALAAGAPLLMAEQTLAQGSTITQCVWTNPGGPSSITHYTPWRVTDEGWLWDTQERKCTTVYYGPARWCTWERSRTCEVSCGIGIGMDGPSAECGFSYSYTDSPPTYVDAPGQAMKCIKQTSCLWTSDTEVPVLHKVQAHDIADRGADTVPGLSRPSQGSVLVFQDTRSTHEGLVNLWASSDVRFHGRTIPYGGAVQLDRFAPGTYVYTVTPSPSLGFPFRMLRFNVTVQRSSTLTNIASFTDVNPMAIVRYTNNSPYDQFVDFSITPQQVGLVASLRGNQFNVAAGGSVDLEVEFYTAPGYIMLAGQQYTAKIDARSITPTGEILATGQAIAIEVAAADVNADGAVDGGDVGSLINVIDHTAEKALFLGVRADLVADGWIDTADLEELMRLIDEE